MLPVVICWLDSSSSRWTAAIFERARPLERRNGWSFQYEVTELGWLREKRRMVAFYRQCEVALF
jgi:hypothetical protein